MEKLTVSNVGNLEKGGDCRLSDAGGVGPCSAVGAAEGVGQQPPGEALGCKVALPPSGGQRGKCSSHHVLLCVFIHQSLDISRGCITC